MEDSTVNPKDLEILPVRLVQAALQRGVLSQDAANDVDWSAAAAINKQLAKYAPKYRRFSRDAISTLNRAASLFVLYIVSIAQEHAKSKKRATVYDKDIMEALKQGLFWEIEREMSEEMLKIYEEMRHKEVKPSGEDGGSDCMVEGEEPVDGSTEEVLDGNIDHGDIEEAEEEIDDYDDINDVVEDDTDVIGDIPEEDMDGIDGVPEDQHPHNDAFNGDTHSAEFMEHEGYPATLGDSNVIDAENVDDLPMTFDEGGMELVYDGQSQGTITENQQNINTQYS